jgi:two-component system osmolarity sensor histidine kinase EnvZ
VSLIPRTLFGKTAVTLTVAFLYFSLFTFTAVVYYVQVPVARQAAEDLATFLVMAAGTWASLPPLERQRFGAELYEKHGIKVSTEPMALDERPPYHPYLALLEAALKRHTGVEALLRVGALAGQRWYWLEMTGPEGPLKVGFPHSRLGARIPTALLTVLLASAALVLATAMTLASRITKPLSLLSSAAERVGKGEATDPLPETGPAELAALISQFNRMAQEVRELLANRTTLLAGVSHDLRTPLARLSLAVEMLPPDADPVLVAGIHRDLDEMNRLIGDALVLSRDLSAGRRERADLCGLVEALVEQARELGGTVRWAPDGPCAREVNVTAFRRILDNLLGNAIRYGQGAPVTVELKCRSDAATVRVLDRGPGVPASQREAVFRPFYRLEQSRSSDTGGSGLGLAIARQLANANGWSVDLLEREGGGTVAELTLPAPEDVPGPGRRP